MVSWFDAFQLIWSGSKVLVSTLIGQHADRRLVEALRFLQADHWSLAGPPALAALPFCHLNLKSPKPDARYPIQLQRLRDHIRKRRLDLGLRQRDVARQVGANLVTILNWEKGRSEPKLHFVPAIFAFLASDPRPILEAFGDRFRQARTAQGLSIHSLTAILGVDETTVWKWEEGQHRPISRLQRRLDELLAGLPERYPEGKCRILLPPY